MIMDPIALLRGSRELSTPIGPIETDARMPTENRDVRGTLVCNGLEIPSEASVEVISDIILCVQRRAFSSSGEVRISTTKTWRIWTSSGPKIEPFKMATHGARLFDHLPPTTNACNPISGVNACRKTFDSPLFSALTHTGARLRMPMDLMMQLEALNANLPVLMPSMLRAAALRLELSARAELEHRGAVALGRHHYPTAAVHEVAQAVTAMTRHRLLRALIAGFGVVLAHGPSLFKLRGASVTRVCEKTLSLGPGGGAARAIAAALSSAASSMAWAVALAGWRWQAAIVAGTIIADRLIRCHVARLDGRRACSRASTTRKTNRGALDRLRGALGRLFDPLDGLSERIDPLVPWSFQFQSQAWPHGRKIPVGFHVVVEPVVLEIQAVENNSETQSTMMMTEPGNLSQGRGGREADREADREA